MHYLRTGVVCEISLPMSSISYTDSFTRNAQRDLSAAADTASLAEQEDFRILIVEDSFLLVMELETVFGVLGWKVAGTASRKSEALAMAASKSFDAALLDVNLDGEMSWDVAAFLQKRGIPFVFSTGYDVSRILPEEFAGSAILGKPFNVNELEHRLRQVITHARGSRQMQQASAAC
jgi:DNA-binding response OmpR family regulator